MSVLQACADGKLSGVRDAAIIITAYTCGLRRGELAGLQLSDLDQEARSLHIVGGKGDKERLVYMGLAQQKRSNRGDSVGYRLTGVLARGCRPDWPHQLKVQDAIQSWVVDNR